MKKTTVALLMAVTICLSGAAGFGGAILAGFVRGADAQAGPVYGTSAQPDAAVYQSLGVSFDNAAEAAQNDAAGDDTITDGITADALLAAYDVNNNRTPLTIPQIARTVGNSVVEIATERAVRSSLFGQYIQSGAGSGVIVSSDGYIVTTNHVIDGAGKITVTLKSGAKHIATQIGRDIKTDLAVIKIEASDLQPAQYGNSNALVVGELAVAIGNPLGELGGTVTDGIISALNRDINIDGEMMNLLQTSAAVNPGNSGGGLFNAYGELIGVVNAKSGGSNIDGIGFAIPSDTVKTIAGQLIQNGYVEGRVDLGISLVEIDDMFTAMRYGVSNLGVYVYKSDTESGLQAGDRIVSINGTEVKSAVQVKSIYEKYKVGDKLELVISRGSTNHKTTITLKQAK